MHLPFHTEAEAAGRGGGGCLRADRHKVFYGRREVSSPIFNFPNQLLPQFGHYHQSKLKH